MSREESRPEHLQPMEFGDIEQPSCHSEVGARSVWLHEPEIGRTELDVVMKKSMSILKCIGALAFLGMPKEESMSWCLSLETETQR